MMIHFLFAAMIPTLSLGYTIRGYDMFGRPVTLRQVQPNCTPLQHRRDFSRQNRAVDLAFEALRNDLAQPPNEEIVAKSKEWIDRSFEFLAELNKDAARSPKDAERNEELLQKQKKWVNKFVDFATEVNKDVATEVETVGPKQNQSEHNVSTETMVPLYSLKDEAAIFQVELELPGVLNSDIDIQLDNDGETLTISGERKLIGDNRVAKFSKFFYLESTVQYDKISATLRNGILTVSAPKKVKREEDKSKRILIQSE
jgi:HSP20 family molecular chaperone IbpA